jgi:hypothetical protein
MSGWGCCAKLLLLIIGILLLRSPMMPFRPDRVTTETTVGEVLTERSNPPAGSSSLPMHP